MKADLFQSCGHCWVFQICWHIECSTFTASYFTIWNNSAGIPSPPLALFIMMLPKTHLTSQSKMSGSRWMITQSRLSGSWRSFLYSSSVYPCHLFLIFSAYVRSIPFLSFIVPIFAQNIPLASLIFLKRFLVFSILLFSSISLHWSLRKAFLSLLTILWNSALRWIYLSFSSLPFTSLLFSTICKASSDNHFAFLHFFFLGIVLITTMCSVVVSLIAQFAKESACNAGDPSSIPGLGRSPGEVKGYPLQYTGLEISIECIVRGVKESQTRLSDFHFHSLSCAKLWISTHSSSGMLSIRSNPLN